jgi:hypothetical protein
VSTADEMLWLLQLESYLEIAKMPPICAFLLIYNKLPELRIVCSIPIARSIDPRN